MISVIIKIGMYSFNSRVEICFEFTFDGRERGGRVTSQAERTVLPNSYCKFMLFTSNYSVLFLASFVNLSKRSIDG